MENIVGGKVEDAFSLSGLDRTKLEHYLCPMKKFNLFLTLGLLVALAAGCGTAVKSILPRQDGTWKTGTFTFRNYVNSSVDSTWTINPGDTYTFDKSGSGTRADSSGTSHVVVWSVNPEGDIVSLCYNTPSSQNCQLYYVVSSGSKEQKWKATINGAVNGTWQEQDWTLNRVE